MLLTDGSVNTKTRIGYGAYLVVPEPGLTLDCLRKCVRVRRFEDTSSTKLEMQTLLWALGEIDVLGRKVIVYTDSQNILGLSARRERFEQNMYRSRRKQRLGQSSLYQAFFRMTDLLDCEFVKVPGHRPPNQKDAIDELFTLVDRAARKALRGDSL